MESEILALLRETKNNNSVFLPTFYYLSNSEDKKKFDLLLKTPGLQVVDEIKGQVEELIKSRNPKVKFEKQNLEDEAVKFLDRQESWWNYGVWVYYSWSNRLIHLLDEAEFTEVRTNRNLYKITPEERTILATKRVGIIGLSVGQSVAVTMAMERSCGELRLADFDILELTNLNRIRIGCHNLGLSKTISVAREIAEIDPFIKVVCYTDGLNTENMDKFFLSGGKLDLLIDECDGLDIKILARYKAKLLNIPVLMEASDRGLLDVERFDLSPERPILHGLIPDLDPERLKALKSNEEKIPYLLAMIGFESISVRLKASMLEIEQSITTWPQLASAVTFGGGLTADVARRIFLNQFTSSGRFYVDLDDLVTDKKVNHKLISEECDRSISLKEMHEIAESLGEKETTITYELAAKLIEAATLAPSPGNNQPWKWLYTKGNLYLFIHQEKISSFGDFNNMGTYQSFGAALKNLQIESSYYNLIPHINLFPHEDDRLIASVSFVKTTGLETNSEVHKHREAIRKRATFRKTGTREKLNENVISNLKTYVNTFENIHLSIFEDHTLIDKIGEIISACERIRFLDPRGHEEIFNKELRWTRQEKEASRDGIEIDSFELTTSELAGMKIAKDPEVVKILSDMQIGSGFEKLSGKSIASASAIGLFTIPDLERKKLIFTGQAFQQLWLNATLHGLQIHPMTAPAFLFARLNNDRNSFSAVAANELDILQQRFHNLLPEIENKQCVFIFKIGIGAPEATMSLRRSLEFQLYN